MPRRKSRNYKPPVTFIAICILVAAVSVIFAFALKMFFMRYPYFNITKVSIYGVDESRYADFKRRLIGKNIFSLDLITLKDHIEQEQQDAQCISVQRRPPGELLFFLKKRIPIAQIKLLRFHLVDDSGAISLKASDLAFADLPIILGLQDKPQKLQSKKSFPPIELRNVIALLKEKNNFSSLNDYTITKIHISADRADALYLAENFTKSAALKNTSAIEPVEVKFDLDKPAETVRVLGLLLRKRALRDIEYIDVKNINSPVILEKKADKAKR